MSATTNASGAAADAAKEAEVTTGKTGAAGDGSGSDATAGSTGTGAGEAPETGKAAETAGGTAAPETGKAAKETKAPKAAGETAGTKTPHLRTGRLLRAAIILVFVGLGLELVPLLYFRPITFLLFFFVGIPLAGLGMLLYVWRVLRELQGKGAL